MLLILSGDINLNPGPSNTSASLNISLLNIRSASSITPELNKPPVLQEFISDKNIDILALTETWLTPDTLLATLNSLTPPNYSLIHIPRSHGKGGGIALLHRSYLKIQTIATPIFSTFEALCVRISISSASYTLLTIYRPPKSSKSQFLTEFSTLLEDLSSSPSELIITGDFNYTSIVQTLLLSHHSSPCSIHLIFLSLSRFQPIPLATFLTFSLLLHHPTFARK